MSLNSFTLQGTLCYLEDIRCWDSDDGTQLYYRTGLIESARTNGRGVETLDRHRFTIWATQLADLNGLCAQDEVILCGQLKSGRYRGVLSSELSVHCSDRNSIILLSTAQAPPATPYLLSQ